MFRLRTNLDSMGNPLSRFSHWLTMNPDKMPPEDTSSGGSMESAVDAIFNGLTLNQMASDNYAEAQQAFAFIRTVLIKCFNDDGNTLSDLFDAALHNPDSPFREHIGAVLFWLCKLYLDAIASHAQTYATDPRILIHSSLIAYEKALRQELQQVQEATRPEG